MAERAKVTREHREAAVNAMWPWPGEGSHMAAWIESGAGREWPASASQVAQALADFEQRGRDQAKAELQLMYAAFEGSGHSPKNPREAAQAIAQMRVEELELEAAEWVIAALGRVIRRTRACGQMEKLGDALIHLNNWDKLKEGRGDG